MSKTPQTQTWLSPKAYGSRRSPPVSRQAVMAAIQTGRISQAALARTDAGHWKIDPVRADADWDAWTDPAKQREAVSPGRPPATPSLFGEERDAERLNHARASAQRVLVDTELRRLELDERRGRLIDREAVTRAAFRVAKATNQRLLAIPDRVSSQLHAAASIQAVHAILTQEIAQALEALSRDLEREVRSE